MSGLSRGETEAGSSGPSPPRLTTTGWSANTSQLFITRDLNKERIGWQSGSGSSDTAEEIIKAADELLAAIKPQPDGAAQVQQTVNQTVIGDHHIISGSGNVVVNRSSQEPPRPTS